MPQLIIQKYYLIKRHVKIACLLFNAKEMNTRKAMQNISAAV